jgi:hypothetical protein
LRAAIAERAHVREVHARQRQPYRLGAGRKQEPLVGDPAAIDESDLAGTHVDVGGGRLQPQFDALFGVEALCA